MPRSKIALMNLAVRLGSDRKSVVGLRNFCIFLIYVQQFTQRDQIIDHPSQYPLPMVVSLCGTRTSAECAILVKFVDARFGENRKIRSSFCDWHQDGKPLAWCRTRNGGPMSKVSDEYRPSRRLYTDGGQVKGTVGRTEVLERSGRPGHTPPEFKEIIHGLDEIRLRLERLEEVPRASAPESEDLPEDMRFYRWLRRSYRERLLRREAFEQDFIVSDPSWDMLLDLCISEIEGRKISVTSVCLASGAPTSTAVRWIGLLEHEGMIERRPDPDDKRRVFVRISRKAFDKMFHYFKRIGVR